MRRFEVEVIDSIKSFVAQMYENVLTLKQESDHQLFFMKSGRMTKERLKPICVHQERA